MSQSMTMMMPLMFGFFSLNFSTGLSFYFIVSNIIGIITQGFISGWEGLLFWKGLSLCKPAARWGTSQHPRQAKPPSRQNPSRPRARRERKVEARNERRSVVASGKTVEDAIANGLAMLEVRRDQVDVEILSEGSRGVLGFGAENARVQLLVKPPAAAQASQPARLPSAIDPACTDTESARPTLNAAIPLREARDPGAELEARRPGAGGAGDPDRDL